MTSLNLKAKKKIKAFFQTCRGCWLRWVSAPAALEPAPLRSSRWSLWPAKAWSQASALRYLCVFCFYVLIPLIPSHYSSDMMVMDRVVHWILKTLNLKTVLLASVRLVEMFFCQSDSGLLKCSSHLDSKKWKIAALPKRHQKWITFAGRSCSASLVALFHYPIAQCPSLFKTWSSEFLKQQKWIFLICCFIRHQWLLWT